ncbi:MAG: cupredoxin domain-containing protein [Chitinophagales bacterium]|nr:cupredoxin domain-containing protein [Chitinophagales bacterium]
MKTVFFSTLLFVSLSFISCDNNYKTDNQNGAEDTSVYISEEPAKTYDPQNIDPAAPVMELNLEAQGNSMDVMAFSTNEIRVKNGTTVKINFRNTATDAAMKHNFFVVKNGTIESVAMESNTAGPDKDFIPEDKSNLLYTSKLLEPGQSEEMVFAAPPVGIYQFVCTYPGHWQRMNGKFIVE